MYAGVYAGGLVQRRPVTEILPAEDAAPETDRFTRRERRPMGYREDPEARSTLKAAFMGLGFALVWLLIVFLISFGWAGGFSGGH